MGANSYKLSVLRLHLDRKLVGTAAFVEVGMVALVPLCQKAGRVRVSCLRAYVLTV